MWKLTKDDEDMLCLITSGVDVRRAGILKFDWKIYWNYWHPGFDIRHTCIWLCILTYSELVYSLQLK